MNNNISFVKQDYILPNSTDYLNLVLRIQSTQNKPRNCIDFDVANLNLAIDGTTVEDQTRKFPSFLGVPTPWATRLLEGLSFENLTFTNCDFSHVNLRAATFSNVAFVNCTFKATTLDQTVFDTVTFTNGHITDSSFHDAILLNVKFRGTHLSGNFSIGKKQLQVSYDDCVPEECCHLLGSNSQKTPGLHVLIPWLSEMPSHSISMVIQQVKHYGAIPLRYDYRYFLDRYGRYQPINQERLRNETTLLFKETQALATPIKKLKYACQQPDRFPQINSIVSTAQQYVELADRVILPGGDDIDPRFYGQEPDPHTKCGLLERDLFEYAILLACEAQQKDTLGICRGMQVIHTSAGGSLVQHCPKYLNEICKTTSNDGSSETVYTYFHQILTAATPDFEVTMKVDDVIVAMRISKAQNWKVEAVLFHPECKLPNLQPGDQADFADKLSPYNIKIIQTFLNKG